MLLRESKATLALAMPIILGSASQIVMGVIDSIMIGAVGTVPLAASAFTGSVFTFFYLAGIGLLLPLPVLVARTKVEDGHGPQWLRHGLALALGSAVPGVLAMLLLLPVSEILGQPLEVTQAMTGYFLFITASLVPALLYQALRQYAEARGRPWMPLFVTLAGVLLNGVLNWILIYGNLGAPALGLAGAGLATLIARLFITGLIAFLLQREHRGEPGWPQTPAAWCRGLGKEKLTELLRLGLPCAGQLLFEVCAFTAAAIMMGWLGTTSLAAHQIALSCAALTFMFPLGLSAAASIRISRALAHEELSNLRTLAYSALVPAWFLMVFFALCFFLFGQTLAELFVRDPEVTTLAARLLLIAGIFQLFDGTQVVCSGTLRGLSDVKIPTFITGLAYWCVAVPTSYFFGVHGIGPTGVWWGLAAGLALAAFALGWRLLRLTQPAHQPH